MNAWMDEANCRGADPVLFDPDQTADTALARLLCGECPVRRECLSWALNHAEVGVWGGTDDNERKRLRRRLGIKVVRHELPIACGTPGGARTHQRRGEQPCRACRDAYRTHNTNRLRGWTA